MNKKFVNSFKKNFSELKSIPIIDISPLRNGNEKDKCDIGRQIDEANSNIGFFMIKNTGIDFNFIRQTIDQSEKFFLSDMENKMKCRVDDPPEFKAWGYFPRNREVLERGKDLNKKQKNSYLNDINESFNMQNDNPMAGLPKRIYPDFPPEFKEVFPRYWNECENLSNLLMTGFAYGLNMPEAFFKDKFNYCASALRVLHYPEGVKLKSGQFRASEHTDYGSLTILYSTASGLQVKDRDGNWIDVDVPWEHFVINIGDLMAFWTNDRWVSTPHRVITRDSENPVKRFSLAFFHNPNRDVLVDCIESCRSKNNPAKYKRVVSGDFILQKFKASIGEA
jgi:isopenicillin N synthase-like dioxygenase